MTRQRPDKTAIGLLACGAILLATGYARAQTPSQTPDEPGQPSAQPAEKPSAETTAAMQAIDQYRAKASNLPRIKPNPSHPEEVRVLLLLSDALSALPQKSPGL